MVFWTFSTKNTKKYFFKDFHFVMITYVEKMVPNFIILKHFFGFCRFFGIFQKNTKYIYLQKFSFCNDNLYRENGSGFHNFETFGNFLQTVYFMLFSRQNEKIIISESTKKRN